ncbi:MAG: SurA N-terminal domain-containing protein [Verrucomicrobiales bacterium]|nr:SurA N-terminal domain-containing protein [Verrucomicrobiales bacterium]
MLETMRKHHYVMMLIITTAVILSMSIWGVWDQGQNQQGGLTIFGKTYNEQDMKAASAVYGTAAMLGTNSQFGMAMPGNDPAGKLFGLLRFSQSRMRSMQDSGPGAADVLASLIVIREEAKKLGIAVEDADLQKGVESLARFQTNGQFNRKEYDKFFEGASDRGAAEANLFQMLKDALLLEKLQQLVGGSLDATDYQVNLAYNQMHMKTTAQVMVFPRKEHEAIKATEEDAKNFYEANKGKAVAELDPEMKSESARDVNYVKLSLAVRDEKPDEPEEDISKLPADQQEAKKKELEAKRTARAQEKEAKKKEWDAHDRKIKLTAKALGDALVEGKKLAEAVASIQGQADYAACEVKTVAGLVKGSPPDELKDLKNSQMDSSVVDVMFEEDKDVASHDKGYVLFEVTKKADPVLLTLEQAQGKLIEKLTKEKIGAALQEKASTARSKIQEGLAAKKPFADAAKDAGVTAVEWVFPQKTPPKDPPPWKMAVEQQSAELTPGSLGASAVPSGDDLVLVYLDKRELPDDPKMKADKELLKVNRGMRSSPFQPSPLFTTWFQQRMEEAIPAYTNAEG